VGQRGRMIARAITREQIFPAAPSGSRRPGDQLDPPSTEICRLANPRYIESVRQRLVYPHHVALLLSYSAGRRRNTPSI
jgi:hypothetical protein